MDFTAFMDLLETSTLFFTRCDKFKDRFEGTLSPPTLRAWREVAMKIGAPAIVDFTSDMTRRFRCCLAVNCWHMNEHESAAMWRLYLKSGEGVAIQATYDALVQALSPAKEDVYIGTVKYIDYDTEEVPSGNLFDPILCKRRSFEHERELRAVIGRFPDRPDLMTTDEILNNPPIGDGIRVRVELGELVKHVYVAPESPAWFHELVQAVVARYGLIVPVANSRLADDPLY